MLLRDIQKGNDPTLQAIAGVIGHIAPDILLLTDFDYDLDGLALAAFAATLAVEYPYLFSQAPNAGYATGLDIDGNDRTGDARDGLGYGRFAGDGGLAVLSRYPILAGDMTDHSALLWRDLVDARLPQIDGAPFLSPEVLAILPVSSTAHWIVPIALPDEKRLNLMTFSATPPVFDGPEDMNGLRARDELRLWDHTLDGRLGPAPDNFVVAGNSNLDPNAGQGDRLAMAAFLARPDLQDAHTGLSNADWGEDSAGQMRVSHLLPSTSLTISGAGTFWPLPEDPLRQLIGQDGMAAGPHRLVWLDLRP